MNNITDCVPTILLDIEKTTILSTEEKLRNKRKEVKEHDDARPQ